MTHDVSYVTTICCTHGWRCSSCMFQDLFGAAQLPSAAVFNPHKRCHGRRGHVLVCCCAANLKKLSSNGYVYYVYHGNWITSQWHPMFPCNLSLLWNLEQWKCRLWISFPIVVAMASYSVWIHNRPNLASRPPDSASLSWTTVKMARRRVVCLHTMQYILSINIDIYI